MALATPAPTAAPPRRRFDPVGQARAAWIDWWAARLPATDTLQLGQRNVYILPTRGGWAFALTLVLMLLGSINYQLSLGYALVFLLTGAALVSMHMTHATLRGLTLRLRTGAPVFAGQPAAVEVLLASPDSERHAVAVHFQDRLRFGSAFAWVEVPARGHAGATLSIVPAERGWCSVPPVVVSTGYPFGLFRAWAVWRPASRVLAWPRPEWPAPPLPPAQATAGEAAAATRERGGELDGVRAWQRGDALRQIAWKKVARSGELVSRETSGSGRRELHLGWAEAAGAGSGTEARIARLAAWVLAAEHAGLRWSLQLPGLDLPAGQGEAQQRAALEALALLP